MPNDAMPVLRRCISGVPSVDSWTRRCGFLESCPDFDRVVCYPTLPPVAERVVAGYRALDVAAAVTRHGRRRCVSVVNGRRRTSDNSHVADLVGAPSRLCRLLRLTVNGCCESWSLGRLISLRRTPMEATRCVSQRSAAIERALMIHQIGHSG